jgi:hypothetical protein
VNEQSKLVIVPCHLRQANAFVAVHHRHHEPIQTHKYSLAVCDESGTVRGVSIVNRPASRMLDDAWTLEVARLATDGCENACSALYGASWRVAKAMGYRKMLTYILDTEPGTSLLASGWKCLGSAGGGTWSRPSRPRVDHHPLGMKLRWEVTAVAADVTVLWPSAVLANNIGQISLLDEVPA